MYLSSVAFKDHFSEGSDRYAAFRPRYPEALFDFVAGESPRRNLAWDCATGTGQSALGLAERFRRVVATDASGEQVAHAEPHPRVEYRVAPAEASGLEAGSADVVTVAQALHWFDLDAFYAEVRRVLGSGGLLAVWSYGLTRIDPAIDAIVTRFYGETVGPFWPPERRLVEDGYRSIPFPFSEVRCPDLAIERWMTLGELAGYLRTWSAVRRYVERHGHDPVVPLVDELGEPWGEVGARRLVSWPIRMRAGR